MTAQPVEANVVLTSDNSQYDRSMDTSAAGTDRLGASVDTLGRKINNLAKTAGKTLIGISAADVAVITGATAAWSSYEKQMQRLQAQSAILTRSNAQQTAVMKDYTAAVKTLRTEYGTTTTEAAKLVETLSKITSIRQSRDLQDLSKVFVDMSHATGESSEGLASSLTNLQRVMGTPINSKNTRTYADQFTYLAAQTQTSAQGLVDFTAQLAPTAKAMGMSNNAIAGFATAFAKSGQDSGAAATVFSKITTDITHSLQTGSPEIAHYANLLGVTQKAFKGMGAGEQVVEILEKLHSEGKGAAAELNRLGLDGPRSIRAIQAIIGTGNLRESMGLARTGAKSNAAQEGADATEGMSREIDKLSQNFQQLAETMGGYFGPVLTKFLEGMNKALEITNKIAEGPLGHFVALVMDVVAPLAAGAGAMLLFAGALLKVAAAFTLFRSSGAYGFREGRQGGGPLGTAGVGDRGRELESAGTWFQRAQYTGGQYAGSLTRSAMSSARTGWQAGRAWADPNYVPGPPRSMASYLAGGLGRGMDLFLTPQFDQMRYRDATKRERSRFFSRSVMGMSAGVNEAATTADEARQRASQAGAVYQSRLAASPDDPATEQARRDMHRANQEAISATRASVQATKEQVVSQQNLNRETRNTSEGFMRLTRAGAGFVAGAGGGILGATRAGAGMFMRSGLAAPTLAMGTMAGASALGVQSNMVMMGATGAMLGSAIGPEGTAIGAGVGSLFGAGVDMAQANNKMSDSIKALTTNADEAAKTGTGLSDLQTSLTDTQSLVSNTAKNWDLGSASTWFGKPKSISDTFGALKSGIEGVFGSSDTQEAQRGVDAQRARILQQQGAAQDLAKRAGIKLTGTAANQRRQLDDFMSGAGGQRLAGAGIDPQDLIAARTAMIRGDEGASEKYQAMLTDFTQSGASRRAGQRAESTAAGRAMADSGAAQRSIRLQADVGAFYTGTSQIFDKLRKQGMTDLQIMESTEKAQARIGDENDRQYDLQMAVSAKAQQNLQMQMPLMTRAQGFQASIGQLNAISGITPRTEEQAQQLEQQKTAAAQAFVDQASYFKQMLLMQDQYEIQRRRAQQDYSLQRSYQETDYQLQRGRAEYSFHLSQSRATADYYRGVRRAHYDFNLQRSRAEDDYQHSVEIQAKQMAMTVYDIYQRVQVQRTSSASQLLSNASDQLQRMRQQERDLDRLRAMGGTDSMIQQMKFTDPANQQQLARFMAEATPRMIRQFNQVAGSLREGAAAALVNDPSSLDADERRRQHRLQLERSRQDFQRQLELGHDDFTRALGRQRADFNLMMDQQAHDFDTQMGRQADAYQLSMQRSAEDLANVGKEIDGNFEQILTQATRRLTGHAKEQAQAVLASFRTLKGSSSAEAVATMKDLAEIFGFKYQAPRGVGGGSGPGAPEAQPGDIRHPGVQPGAAQGAVVPGYTPGRDTTTINVGGGEAIMRPEWTRAMGGEKVIDALNHQARHGGFAGGGVVWPLPSSTWSTYPGHDGIDLNAPNDFGKPFYAAAPGRISYTGWGHGYGDAIFETGPYGTLVYGHGSKVGVRAGQRVSAGQYLGNVGSTGNSTGPHLHIGFPGGTSQEILAFLAGAEHSGYGAAAPLAQGMLASVLRNQYPRSERAAAAMQGVHPLLPGDITKVMNRMTRDVVRRLRRQAGDTMPSLGSQPDEHLDNEGIVHVGANRMGWGNQWPSLREIVMHESGFRNTAQNPTSTAYGMFQFLDSTWGNYGGHKTSDPWLQTKYGLKYIKDRYQDPNGAWRFWQEHNWYGDGAVFDGPQTIGVGERGPEAVIPLNDRGGEFLAKAMMGSEMRGMGMGSSPMRGGMNVFNTRVDRSTNFTGPITVQANDPTELLSKLQARQRVMALSRPSLTGSAA